MSRPVSSLIPRQDGEKRVNALSADYPSPASVLNADIRPLRHVLHSPRIWQDNVKAAFLKPVNILSTYDHVVCALRFEMTQPGAIARKEFVLRSRSLALTWFTIFLRNRLTSQYCGDKFPTQDVTFDHVIPRSREGRTNWQNSAIAKNNLVTKNQCIAHNPFRRSVSYICFRITLASVFAQLDTLLSELRGFRREGWR